MESWIILSVAAAAFQTLRFALQKLLKASGLSAGAATMARFSYALPFVLIILAGGFVFSEMAWPEIGDRFWLYGLIGAASQVLATWCVVALFSYRNFAVGITFKKTEVMLTALVGFVVLGDTVSALALVAITIGLIGVLVLSQTPQADGSLWQRLFNRATGLGLLSGVFFAFSAVGYRGATLEVGSDLTFIRAIITLGFVCLSQNIGLGLWLRFQEPGALTSVVRVWKQAIWMGAFSMAGSLCWFMAFTLQNAALVFAVGQIEVIFSLAVSVVFFGEITSRREILGIVLITGSVMALAFS